MVATCVVSCVAVWLSSCAGTPEPRPPANPYARLGTGALVYLGIDLDAVQPISDRILAATKAATEVRDPLKRSDRVEIALFPAFFSTPEPAEPKLQQGESSPKFRLTAYGNYPRFWADFSFFWNPAWKKVRVTPPYWRSDRGMNLALDQDGAALLSDSDPWVQGPGPEVPACLQTEGTVADGKEPDGKDAALVAWIAEPDKLLARMPVFSSGLLRVPLKELCFTLTPKTVGGEGDFPVEKAAEATKGLGADGAVLSKDAVFALECVVGTGGEREARGLFALLRLIRPLVLAGLGEPDASVIDQQYLQAVLIRAVLEAEARIDGSSVRFAGRDFSASELASMLTGASAQALYFASR